jgi:hypothetical protein
MNHFFVILILHSFSTAEKNHINNLKCHVACPGCSMLKDASSLQLVLGGFLLFRETANRKRNTRPIQRLLRQRCEYINKMLRPIHSGANTTFRTSRYFRGASPWGSHGRRCPPLLCDEPLLVTVVVSEHPASLAANTNDTSAP